MWYPLLVVLLIMHIQSTDAVSGPIRTTVQLTHIALSTSKTQSLLPWTNTKSLCGKPGVHVYRQTQRHPPVVLLTGERYELMLAWRPCNSQDPDSEFFLGHTVMMWLDHDQNGFFDGHEFLTCQFISSSAHHRRPSRHRGHLNSLLTPVPYWLYDDVVKTNIRLQIVASHFSACMTDASWQFDRGVAIEFAVTILKNK